MGVQVRGDGGKPGVRMQRHGSHHRAHNQPRITAKFTVIYVPCALLISKRCLKIKREGECKQILEAKFQQQFKEVLLLIISC